VRIDLTRASQETVKLLNALAKDGFRVRDLFVSDSISNLANLLLERSR
jgi:hypothetical protein